MNNQQNSKLNLHNTIASRIKQRLIDLDLQQKDIIDALGVPKSTVSEWVKKNEKRTPNTEYLIELSKCLKCSVDYLVGITEASTPLRSEEQQILRLLCDYTGLTEFSIKTLNESSLKPYSTLCSFIDFLLIYFSKNNQVIIELNELHYNYENYLDNLDNYTNLLQKSINSSDLFNSIKNGIRYSNTYDEESCITAEDAELNIYSIIRDNEYMIDGSRYKLDRVFSEIIQQFALSKCKKNITEEIIKKKENAFYSMHNEAYDKCILWDRTSEETHLREWKEKYNLNTSCEGDDNE